MDEELRFDITREGLLGSKVVKPGAYLLRITSIEQKPGKNDPSSTTTEIKFEIESGPDPDAIGVPITDWLTDKQVPAAVAKTADFFSSLYGKKVDDALSLRPKASEIVGRKIKGYIINDKYNNRMMNRVDGYLPA
jgi:hypothetical protein